MFSRWFKRQRSRPSVDYTPCPHCGAMIQETASFCRQCGASEESGWTDESDGWAADDDDFDYDEYVSREFPSDAPAKPDAKKLIIIILLISFSFGTILGVLHILGITA